MTADRLSARQIVRVLGAPDYRGEDDDEVVAARKWINEKCWELESTPVEIGGKKVLPGYEWTAREARALWLDQQLDDLRDSFFCSQCDADPDGFAGHCAGCGRVF